VATAPESVLELAHQEARTGYAEDDERRIRDAAEKAWLAATLAVDRTMLRKGVSPGVGPGAQDARQDFLESLDRQDLSDELSIFADQLHGRCFYHGHCPPRDRLQRGISRVGSFLQRLEEI
jgi:hypothetical protein